MKTRFRSVMRKVPWKLALKALVFAGAWLVAPPWLFWLIALGTYLVPLFRPFELLVPFIATLGVAVLAEPSGLVAAYLGVLIFLVVGIKDFDFIDRAGSYELLTSLLALGLGFLFFASSPAFDEPLSLFVILAGTWLLASRFLRFVAGGDNAALAREAELELRRADVASVVVALLIAEFAWVIMLLPLTVFFSAALFFLGIVVSLSLARRSVQSDLTRTDVLFYFSLFFSLVVILLAANQWGL